MAVDEGTRHRIHRHFLEQMGEADANGLMELLPPVGWADVATKRDLDALEERLTAKIDSDLGVVTAKISGDVRGVTAKIDNDIRGVTAKITASEERLVERIDKSVHEASSELKTLFIGMVVAFSGVQAAALGIVAGLT